MVERGRVAAHAAVIKPSASNPKTSDTVVASSVGVTRAELSSMASQRTSWLGSSAGRI